MCFPIPPLGLHLHVAYSSSIVLVDHPQIPSLRFDVIRVTETHQRESDETIEESVCRVEMDLTFEGQLMGILTTAEDAQDAFLTVLTDKCNLAGWTTSRSFKGPLPFFLMNLCLNYSHANNSSIQHHILECHET